MDAVELYYSRDPIVEAILGIAIEPIPNERVSDLQQLQTAAGQEYTNQQLVQKLAGQFDLATGSTTSTRTPVGYSFQTPDSRETFTARTDMFLYHRLKPYPGWQEFRDEAARLWNVYRTAVHEPRITQCELRYINRLELPAGQELNLYLQTFPEVGKSLPQMLLGYVLEAVLKLDSMLGGQVILRQRMVPSDIPDHVSIILDNSVIFHADADEQTLWGMFDTARVEKNRIFQGCITSAMEDRIK
jgi:uncharacterized protein (TIGR04255 family)